MSKRSAGTPSAAKPPAKKPIAKKPPATKPPVTKPPVNSPAAKKRPRSAGPNAVAQILDAAERVLVDVGYDVASTNRIAQEAGVSIGAIYHHFPNKEAVVAAVVERFTDEAGRFILERMVEVAGETYPVIARTMLEAYVGFLRKRRDLVRVIVEQIPRLGHVNKVATIEARMAKAVRNYLTRNRESLGIVNLEAATFISVQTISLLGAKIALDPPPGATQAQLVDEVHLMMSRYVGSPL